MQKPLKTIANGYSSGGTQRELSNEYQHDRVYMVFKNHCIFVLSLSIGRVKLAWQVLALAANWPHDCFVW